MQPAGLVKHLYVAVVLAALAVGSLLLAPGARSAQAFSPALDPASASTYTVQSGDTLGAIASSLGYTGSNQTAWINAVVQLNGMSGPDQLSVGQVLKLPGTSSGSSTGSSTAGGGSASTGTTNVSSTTSTASTTPAVSSYTVQSGDTLGAIASSLGYTGSNQTAWINAVVQLNGMSGPDQLSVGQVLNLPGTTSSTSTTITPTTTSSSSTGSTGGGTPAVNVNNTNSAATCQSSSLPTCDYASSDTLVIPSLNEGDSSRCNATTIQAPINVYDIGSDGSMGIPEADCDVVRENFAGFQGYGGYPGTGGTTVLAGHVDYHPHYEAVFWNLRQIQNGAEIDYYTKDNKKIVYKVDWEQAISDPNYNWGALAQASSTESLVLITCDGTFNPDTHEYDHRFVAHAVRVS